MTDLRYPCFQRIGAVISDISVVNSAIQTVLLRRFAFGKGIMKVSQKSTLAQGAIECSLSLQQVSVALSTSWIWPD